MSDLWASCSHWNARMRPIVSCTKYVNFGMKVAFVQFNNIYNYR